ncbi:riboflavin biosynthesis protein RibF [Mobiluncus mulieris]|uniref:Riboflavin biosynthesis protein RibF n=1 Tax=Mobiluncus mulieris TaxID=2052 RepID=A0ABD4TV98_9ACTO|nr:riboflavin biosynthesis protein RibF [Mobiluncus mulieris]MCU9968359.1 riboflavin biosynthesis protein RibF [Mobiluncus mulieris]MCU9972591.1 riboflavin biosynthesis protein RibF [Mobiluncus mulieris]MCV0009391.1 riboflavin biosynthesis protein RibF [Mobiluncus mulieris]MCV0014408.1 riboflavin biosynthesis protein RibF [Mobiluncus mulieris]NMW75278.1 riboflavin biosynthesis protein RibF [Mobiluncus mulieris]
MKPLQSDKLPFLAISAVKEGSGWYISLRATLNNWANLGLDTENRNTVETWSKSQDNACDDSY